MPSLFLSYYDCLEAARRADVEAKFGVILAERTVGALLRRLGFRRMSVRPRHPGQDPEASKHTKNFADLVAAVVPEDKRNKPLELWWQML